LFVFDPTAAILGLLFVRRIADHDRNWFAALDLIGFQTRIGNRAIERTELLDFGKGVVEGVGDEHPWHGARRLADKLQQLGVDAKLCHRKRPQLHLERD
jgi:hypothetical protein